jgi:hypothetical protein
MRWNETITLLSDPEKYQDAAGSWHEGERAKTTVFCNPRRLGMETILNTYFRDRVADFGLRASAEVEVRSADYGGQDQAVYRGDEMEVTSVSGGGETVVLTLSRRLANVSPYEAEGGD